MRKHHHRDTTAAKRVRILSVAELASVRDELQRVERGTPAEQMAVVDWALQYKDAYFRTARGELRRCFPKGNKLRSI